MAVTDKTNLRGDIKPAADLFHQAFLEPVRWGRHTLSQFDDHRQWRGLGDTQGPGPDLEHLTHIRLEFIEDGADRGGEQVDAAHDQHVIGPADTAYPGTGAAGGIRLRIDDDMVATAKAQQGHGFMAQCRVYQFPFRLVFPWNRLAGLRLDEFHMGETPGHEMHAFAVIVFRPGGQGDVADPHRLPDLAIERALDAFPDEGFTATGLTRGNNIF